MNPAELRARKWSWWETGIIAGEYGIAEVDATPIVLALLDVVEAARRYSATKKAEELSPAGRSESSDGMFAAVALDAALDRLEAME